MNHNTPSHCMQSCINLIRFDSRDAETLQRRRPGERETSERDWDAVDVNRKRAEGTTGTTGECVCACVRLIGGSIWGSISHSNCLAEWCNWPLSHHKLCWTPYATQTPSQTHHIIQLDKFLFSRTALPPRIPLFISLHFCLYALRTHSFSFSEIVFLAFFRSPWPAMVDGTEVHWRTAPWVWTSPSQPHPWSRAAFQKRAPMATQTALTMTTAPPYRSLSTPSIR